MGPGSASLSRAMPGSLPVNLVSFCRAPRPSLLVEVEVPEEEQDGVARGELVLQALTGMLAEKLDCERLS